MKREIILQFITNAVLQYIFLLALGVYFIPTEGPQGNGLYIYYIPFVNVFYDMVFDSVPTQEELNKMLDTLGLVSALLLSIVISMAFSVDFEEMDKARLRFDNVTSPYNAAASFEDILLEIATVLSISTYFLVGALSIVVLLIVSSSSGMESNGGNVEHRKIWWGWVRWVVLYSFASTLLGSIFALYSFNSISWIKFPDLYVERTNSPPRFPDFTGDSFYGLLRTGTIFYNVCPIVIAFTIISISKCAVGGVRIKEMKVTPLAK
jgi:hypothetical protein